MRGLFLSVSGPFQGARRRQVEFRAFFMPGTLAPKFRIMEKSQIIEDLTREFVKQLRPLGIVHLTVYITGSQDLFSRKYAIQHIPFNSGEITYQDLELDESPIPTTIILKKNNF